VKIIGRLVVLISVMLLGALSPVLAQAPKKGPAPAAAPAPTAPAAAAAPATEGNQPPPPGWVARCGAVSRDAPMECAIEESAVLKTGQLVTLVNIRVPADTRQPTAVVTLPLGINLPAGAKLQIDEGRMYDVQIQTCEQRGCYGSLPVPADLLAALRTGKQLKVSFQNLAKESIAIPLPLTDFAPSYDKIK
jgi:invasion protein IalB